MARSQIIHTCLQRTIANKPMTFLTLTLRHGKEPLKELIDKLMWSFRLLRQHDFWEDKVQGGAAFLEVKRSEKNAGWHPHLHIIMDADFIAKELLQEAWRGITHGSFHVDIQRVKDTQRLQSYVTKYVTKSLDASFYRNPVWLDEAMEALHGRRLCTTFGDWYGTPLTWAEDEELADDLDDASGWHFLADFTDLLRMADSGDVAAWTDLAHYGLRNVALAVIAADTS